MTNREHYKRLNCDTHYRDVIASIYAKLREKITSDSVIIHGRHEVDKIVNTAITEALRIHGRRA